MSFSCKCRGVCPSCYGRRQAESALHLDGIFPNYQYRQWVLSLPYEIRYTVANNPELTSKFLVVFTRSIERWYRNKARGMGYEETVVGSVLFIHRFNSALTLAPHFHSLFLDGVYYKKNEQYFFLSVGSPKKADLEKIVERICTRVKKILSKMEPPENVVIDFQNPTQNGVGHIKVLEHFIPVPKIEYKEDDDPYSAKLNGFSLNAKVVVQKDCNKCNGRMAPIAAIKDKKVARLILEAMKLTTKFDGIKTGMDPPTEQTHQHCTEVGPHRLLGGWNVSFLLRFLLLATPV